MSAMLRFYLSRNRSIVFILVLFTMLYSTHRFVAQIQETIKDDARPSGFSNFPFDYADELKSDYILTSNPTFVPSFFVVSPLIKQLTHNSDFYARRLAQLSGLMNKPNPFSCICGRISDACVCCGSLYIDTKLTNTLPLQKSSPKSLILFGMNDTDAATFCMNVTYLPKKEQIRIAGFLVPKSAFTSTSSISANYPGPKLILFDDIFLNYKSPTQICIENSKTDSELALCLQFSDLRYFYDTSSDHKMAFVGCTELDLVVRRKFIILRYEKFCFRAHRGAIGDVNGVAVVHENSENIPSDTNSSNSIVVKQSNSSISNVNRIKVPAPMDAQDALRGVP